MTPARHPQFIPPIGPASPGADYKSQEITSMLPRFFTLVLLIFMATGAGPLWASESFTIEDIRIEGLQRVSPGTVFNYLPVKVGDEFGVEAAFAGPL